MERIQTPHFIFWACLISIVLISCAQKSTPYDNGPVMSQKNIEKTFKPILEFMDYRPGMSFADVGADRSKVYIQDIDTSVLKHTNFNRIIDYYSSQSDQDLRTKNQIHLTIGTVYNTNLPDSTFDIIYSNGTVHNFSSLDSIARDLQQKLKPGGVVYLRDSFKNDHGEGALCSDPKCAKPLLTVDECVMIMQRNGFKLVRQSPDMSGYPVFGFAVDK
jgi:SAM-dependent methyltransferase